MDPANGWTGGQYSLWRSLVGACLALLCARAATAGGAAPAGTALAVLAGVAALIFAVGWRDRFSAAAAAIAIVTRAGLDDAGATARDAGSALPAALALPLVAHLLLPPAPFGSIAARGRSDPGGGWRFPETVRGILWGAAGALFAAAGVSLLAGAPGFAETVLPVAEGPLRVPAAIVALAMPLGAFVRGARPAAWVAGAALLAPGLPDPLVVGPCLLQLLLFDPAWIPPLRAPAADLVFYDGTCGFCHRSIRVLLAEDTEGDRFRMAPRGSAAFERALPPEVRDGLPSSIVVVPPDAPVRVRSAATVRLLLRLGGVWRLIGTLLVAIPRPLRDLAYRGIAAVRHRLAPPVENACPIVPPRLRARFLPGAEVEAGA